MAINLNKGGSLNKGSFLCQIRRIFRANKTRLVSPAYLPSSPMQYTPRLQKGHSIRMSDPSATHIKWSNQANSRKSHAMLVFIAVAGGGGIHLIR